ncbi:MAG TPA: ATP-binding protein [Treponemataceae bacterium]|nr:ATP-binding protein [Treponemataceae bacterium]
MIERKYTDQLCKEANKHALSILIGSRQVGKSTLLQMIRDRLGGESAYYNLENPLHLSLFNEGYTSFIRQNSAPLVFIDEFQYCKDISSIFKAIYDLNPEIKVYASGSSSLEIHAHLKESLAGRKIERIIFPLTFAEWLQSYDSTLSILPKPGKISTVDIDEKYRSALAQFITFGAMPGLLQCENEIEKREYLHGIYQTYIAKDIKSFLKDESILSFNKMISYLAVNNGTLLNKNTLSTISGESSRQIDTYVDILEGTFTMALIRPLSHNKGKELVKTPKYYLYDQGVVNSILQDFRGRQLRRDGGILNEQFVYWELRKNLDIRYTIYFWRTSDGKEVDFVLEKDRQYMPIEVKSSWPAGKIPPGIIQFFSYYPETMQATVLYDGKEMTVKYENRTINFLPLYKAGVVEMM